MDETQIKQIIERQPLHGTALLDPRCKILLLVCIGFVSYFLAGEVVSLALMLVYGLFIALGNGGKWAAKMIITYIVVAYLNALLRYVQVPVLSVIMSVFGVTVLKLIPIVMMGLWILRTTYMSSQGNSFALCPKKHEFLMVCGPHTRNVMQSIIRKSRILKIQRTY